MSSSFVVCMLVALGASLTSAQTIQAGKCDSSITALSNFTVASYMGRWYEYARSFAINEAGSKCNTADYSLKYDSSVSVGITNTQYYSLIKSHSKVEGKAVFDKGSSVANLKVTFKNVPGSVRFLVLSTDYKNYAIVYGCNDLLLAHSVNIWILTREVSPSEEVLATAYAAIESFGLDSSIVSKTDHSDCTYTSIYE